MYLSGFYLEDLPVISQKCEAYQLKLVKKNGKKYLGLNKICTLKKHKGKIMALEKFQEELLVEEDVKDLNEIVLFNDDVNTFDHVINTLISVCEHTAEQAEQCSLIVHYKGKCTVKTGEFEDLKPRCSKLLEAGLSAEIQ